MVSCLVDTGPSPDTNSSLLTLAPDTTAPQQSCSSFWLGVSFCLSTPGWVTA